jgi:hypothetical protein
MRVEDLKIRSNLLNLDPHLLHPQVSAAAGEALAVVDIPSIEV